jgi:hypothetical protein
LVGLAALATVAGSSGAYAHTGGSTGYAGITVSGNTIRYSLTLSPPDLPAAVAEELVRARSGRPDSRERLVGYIKDKIHLDDRGRRCEPAQGFVEVPARDVESVTLVVDFACASPVSDLRVRDDLFDVLGPNHHTLAKVQWAGGVQQLAFEPGAREGRVAIGGPAPAHAEGSFFRLGVAHILTGYDHLLFLAALLLRGGRLGSLLKIITAFTVAHSITLALAVSGLVDLPGRLVEPLIAASIVWVAVENLLVRQGAPPHRGRAAFAFGLVHGFGFASILAPLSLPSGGVAWALLGFNLGVEGGQALVVIALLPLLAWMHGKPWERVVVSTASTAVAVMGLVWLVERLL